MPPGSKCPADSDPTLPPSNSRLQQTHPTYNEAANKCDVAESYCHHVTAVCSEALAAVPQALTHPSLTMPRMTSAAVPVLPSTFILFTVRSNSSCVELWPCCMHVQL